MSAAVLQPAAGEGRLASFDWRQVESDLDAQGSALLPGLLTPDECAAIAGLYPREDGFRSRVVMSRHGFVAPRQGDGLIFAVHHRPVRGTRGSYRVTMRHGVSQLRSGQRHTLGVIFHDAA